jgi:hypothetical protein
MTQRTDGALDRDSAERLIRGQQLVILGVLAYVAAAVTRYTSGPDVGLLVSVAPLVLFVFGLRWMVMVLGYSFWLVLLLLVLLLVPFINLLVLLRINARASNTLREAGYTVGFFGVRRDSNASSGRRLGDRSL